MGDGLPAVRSLVGKREVVCFLVSPSRPAVLQKPIRSCRAHSSCLRACPAANLVCRRLLHCLHRRLSLSDLGTSRAQSPSLVLCVCVAWEGAGCQGSSLSSQPLSPVCLGGHRSPFTPTGAHPRSGLRGPIRSHRLLTKLQESYLFLVSFFFCSLQLGPSEIGV